MRPWALVGFMLLATSCSTVDLNAVRCVERYRAPDWDALRRDLNAAKLRWDAQKALRYRYTYHPVTWTSAPDLRVSVLGPDEVEVTNLLTQEALPLSQTERQHYTIERLFAQIEGSLNHEPKQACSSQFATYHPTSGFPTEAGWSVQQIGLADAAGGYTIRDFLPMASLPSPPPRAR